jgi:hypothetical protein
MCRSGVREVVSWKRKQVNEMIPSGPAKNIQPSAQKNSHYQIDASMIWTTPLETIQPALSVMK